MTQHHQITPQSSPSLASPWQYTIQLLSLSPYLHICPSIHTHTLRICILYTYRMDVHIHTQLISICILARPFGYSLDSDIPSHGLYPPARPLHSRIHIRVSPLSHFIKIHICHSTLLYCSYLPELLSSILSSLNNRSHRLQHNSIYQLIL